MATSFVTPRQAMPSMCVWFPYFTAGEIKVQRVKPPISTATLVQGFPTLTVNIQEAL